MTRRLLSAYLVDDEPPALSRLSRLLAETGRVAIAGTETQPEVALAFLQATPVDLAFVDIRMPGMTGLELVAQLQGPPPVVFTTAYEEYALRAFEVHAIDYLLKPVHRDDLHRALNKFERLRGLADDQLRLVVDGALARMAAAMQTSPPAGASALGSARLASRRGERIVLVDAAQVTHIVTEDKLVCAITDAGSYALDDSMSELEARLVAHGFVRVHRSAMINLAFLAEIHPAAAGRARVVLRDRRRTEVAVARTRVRELKRAAGLPA